MLSTNALRLRKFRQENPERDREYQRRWEVKNRHKQRAHQAVKRALKRGDLKKPGSCSSCKTRGPVEAHLEDYEDKLRVSWLCRPCHREEHKA